MQAAEPDAAETTETETGCTSGCTADAEADAPSAPSAFVCPITLRVMEWPVVCGDGHSYEENAISRWFELASAARSAARSPMTNEPLCTTALVPNVALRRAIAEWREHSAECGRRERQQSLLREQIRHQLEKLRRDIAETQFWVGWRHHTAVAGVAGAGGASGSCAAAEWYGKAAEKGNKKAQFWLGCMYYDGDGVGKDLELAARWYVRAGTGPDGCCDAQLRLGHMYRVGAGVERSETGARAWYRKAAEQGSADAQHAMGALYYNGNTIARFAVAAGWYGRAAEQGHAEAQYDLGCMHRDGVGVARDAAAAARWFRRAAEQGHAGAQYCVGAACDTVEGDHAAAARWYEKAAAQGHAGAQVQLAMMCGEGVAEPAR